MMNIGLPHLYKYAGGMKLLVEAECSLRVHFKSQTNQSECRHLCSYSISTLCPFAATATTSVERTATFSGQPHSNLRSLGMGLPCVFTGILQLSK